jgi:hypothetical protein
LSRLALLIQELRCGHQCEDTCTRLFAKETPGHCHALAFGFVLSVEHGDELLSCSIDAPDQLKATVDRIKKTLQESLVSTAGITAKSPARRQTANGFTRALAGFVIMKTLSSET